MVQTATNSWRPTARSAPTRRRKPRSAVAFIGVKSLTNGASYGPGRSRLQAYEMEKKAQSEKDHVLHPKDIRELVAVLRKDPVYKKNLGVRNQYWDSSPKAAGKSKHH
jgi:hypothetical protein